MVFLHLVRTMGALWLLSSVRPLQLRALQGCFIQYCSPVCRCVPLHVHVAPAWGGSQSLIRTGELFRDACNHQDLKNDISVRHDKSGQQQHAPAAH